MWRNTTEGSRTDHWTAKKTPAGQYGCVTDKSHPIQSPFAEDVAAVIFRQIGGVKVFRNSGEQLKGQSIGGILAMPCKVILKQGTDEGAPKILKTLDRSVIWQAQTPKMFRHGLLLAALGAAIEKNVAITDEASAMEFHGHAVSLIAGDSRNIKITTAQDLDLAEFLLGS